MRRFAVFVALSMVLAGGGYLLGSVRSQPPGPPVGGPAGGGDATAGTPPAAANREKMEGHGWSESYSFESALQAALADLHAKIPPLSHHPDVGIAAEIVRMVAHVGGNLRPGLEIIVRG